MAMNDDWRQDDKAAHVTKAEALAYAAETVEGISDVLDNIERGIVQNAVEVLRRAAEHHATAAKLESVT